MAVRRRARAVSAARVVAEVRAGVRAGWPEGLTVLLGDDAWHADRARDLLLDSLVPAADRSFALTTFSDDKVEVGEVVGAARSVGMFSSRRVVFVRDAGLLDGEPAALESYAAAPPPGSHILVRAESIDQRRKLGKTLVRAGRVLTFERGGEGEHDDLLREVAAMARELDLELDAAAAGFLLTATDGNLYAVAAELDKARSWSGPGSGPVRIAERDLRPLVASNPSMSGWEIADAVLERDERAGLAATRRLVAAGEEPLRLLGGIAFRTRAMVQAGALVAAGASRRDIGRRLRLGWNADRTVDGARRYSMEELRRFPYHLSEADRALKSRGLDPGAILERLVVKLVRRGRSSSPPRSRGSRSR